VFVNKNIPNSIKILKEAILYSEFKSYPKKALLEIYNKADFRAEEARLRKDMDDQADNFLFDN